MTIVDLSTYPLVHLSDHLTPLTAPQSHSNNRTVSHHSAGEGAGVGCQTKSEAQCQSPHALPDWRSGRHTGQLTNNPVIRETGDPAQGRGHGSKRLTLGCTPKRLAGRKPPRAATQLTRSNDREGGERERDHFLQPPPTPQRTDGSEQEKSGQS